MTTPQPKPTNRTGLIVAAITFACVCCGIAFVGFALSGSPPSSTPNPAQPTPPTRTPTSVPLGETRDQPFPSDAVVDIGGDMLISIVQVTRPADDIVQEGNMFNATPEPDMEYALIQLRVQCTKSTNEKCAFISSNLSVVGSDGNIHELEFVAGIHNELEISTEFFGGATIEGNLVFLVPQGDQNVVLFHEPFLFGSPVYIALP